MTQATTVKVRLDRQDAVGARRRRPAAGQEVRGLGAAGPASRSWWRRRERRRRRSSRQPTLRRNDALGARLAAQQAGAGAARCQRRRVLLAVTSGDRPAVHVPSSTTARSATPIAASPSGSRISRTPTLNTLTHYGSMLSDTLVKVILVAVVGGAMVIVWRRWHDGVFLALAVIVEATVFVIASFIVDRDRPPVEQLDPPAPSGSFPSGHTAAAVAFYGGLFLVVCWHTPQPARAGGLRRRRRRRAADRRPLAGRRGMHHPIDVVAGLAARPRRPRRRAGSVAGRRGRRDRPDAPAAVVARARFAGSTSPSQERTDDQFDTVPDETGSRTRRRARPPPSRRSSPSPVSAGSPRASSTLARRARRPDRPRRAGRTTRARAAAARPARPAPSPRSPRPRSATLTLWVVAIGLLLYALWRLVSDRPAGRELGQGVGDPRRLPRQRGRVLVAGVDGDLVRPATRSRDGQRDRGRQGRAVHPRA